jgi:hypothetical protein
MEEAVPGPGAWGVEIYKISVPSGESLGCVSHSLAETMLSAKGWSRSCLNISGAPFRSELNKTALLSGVQANGTLMLSSTLSRLCPTNRTRSRVPM